MQPLEGQDPRTYFAYAPVGFFLPSVLSTSLFVCRITQKLLSYFHKIWCKAGTRAWKQPSNIAG